MKFKISLFENDERRTGNVNSVVELEWPQIGEVICREGWSPSGFKSDADGKMRRRNGNFESVDLLVLDVDGGCTLAEAEERFSGYAMIIATTRNHQKEKSRSSGQVIPPCDRFRVVIPLSRRILDRNEYFATWMSAKEKWPFIDDACKDVARFYYASTALVSNKVGAPFEVVSMAPSKQASHVSSHSTVSGNARGSLSKHTLNFIANGAPGGQWHASLFKATIDLKQNGFDKEEAFEKLAKACTNPEKKLDDHDLKLITDVYENREPKYGPRIQGTATDVRHYERMTHEERIARYEESHEIIQRSNASATTFVHPGFDSYYRLTMGLTLIGACSGCGKSTTAANLAYQFLLDQPNKDILYISNEEDAATILSRVACLMNKVSYMAYRTSALTLDQRRAVESRIHEISERIEVVEKHDFDMTCLEDVKSVLEAAARNQEKVGLVVLDYLQTVFKSKKRPFLKEFEVSKELGHYLKEYGKRISIPVVVFAQLKPRSESPDMSTRFCNDRTIYHHAVAVIEAKPDFGQKLTEFIIHKTRFGDSQGRSVFLNFNHGRFENIPLDDLQELIRISKQTTAKPTVASESVKSKGEPI